ncbi:LCP family protein [Candidatus Saccharibacteria bacterium]|nr:LCP family protein [Candidatus Saccharibacteria bacterium]
MMKKIRKIIVVVIIIVLLVISGIAIRYFGAFNNFLDKITNRGPEMKEYSVLTLEGDELKELSSLENKSIGFLKTDPKAANAKQVLENEIEFDGGFYDDFDTLTSVLQNKISSAIVLESDRINAILESENNQLQNTKIIYTFEIKLDEGGVEVSEKEVTKEPFVIYISGSDSRSGIKATARSDVNILAVVNPKEAEILLVSIPRDTYVQLHGTTGLKDKLTHAGIYGINLSKTPIEDFLSMKIDHTIKVSFETVVKVVDELDGIEINSDKEMRLSAEGKNKKCEYSVGVQKVDGDCALRFARERKSYQTGDRHRGENQQQVITGIIAKLSGNKSYLLKLPTILDIAADSFETSFKREDVTSFIRVQLGASKNWKVESISIDGAGNMLPTYSMGANLPLYVMDAYPESVANAKAKITKYLVEE